MLWNSRHRAGLVLQVDIITKDPLSVFQIAFLEQTASSCDSWRPARSSSFLFDYHDYYVWLSFIPLYLFCCPPMIFISVNLQVASFWNKASQLDCFYTLSSLELFSSFYLSFSFPFPDFSLRWCSAPWTWPLLCLLDTFVQSCTNRMPWRSYWRNANHVFMWFNIFLIFFLQCKDSPFPFLFGIILAAFKGHFSSFFVFSCPQGKVN